MSVISNSAASPGVGSDVEIVDSKPAVDEDDEDMDDDQDCKIIDVNGSPRLRSSKTAAAAAAAPSASDAVTAEALSAGKLGQLAAALAQLRAMGADGVDRLLNSTGEEAVDELGGAGHEMAHADTQHLQQLAQNLSPEQLTAIVTPESGSGAGNAASATSSSSSSTAAVSAPNTSRVEEGSTFALDTETFRAAQTARALDAASAAASDTEDASSFTSIPASGSLGFNAYPAAVSSGSQSLPVSQASQNPLGAPVSMSFGQRAARRAGDTVVHKWDCEVGLMPEGGHATLVVQVKAEAEQVRCHGQDRVVPVITIAQRELATGAGKQGSQILNVCRRARALGARRSKASELPVGRVVRGLSQNASSCKKRYLFGIFVLAGRYLKSIRHGL